MELWSIVISAILGLVLISLCTGTYFLQASNTEANQSNVLFPFSAAIAPGQTIAQVVNAKGTSQIDCSTIPGTKVNIVGAYVEVVDPYGSCSGKTSPVLNATCGIVSSSSTNSVSCMQDSDCGAGMNCAGSVCKPSSCPITPGGSGDDFDNSKCSCGGTYCPVRPGKPCTQATAGVDCKDPTGALMTCGVNNVCVVNPGQVCMAPDKYTGKSCSLYPLCDNVVTSGVGATTVINNVCNSNTPGNCRPRDASSYLAAKCDGQVTCNLSFDPTDPTSGFGPSPCASNVNPSSGAYTSLPITPGQGGSYTQGYYVHGLYTCTKA